MVRNSAAGRDAPGNSATSCSRGQATSPSSATSTSPAIPQRTRAEPRGGSCVSSFRHCSGQSCMRSIQQHQEAERAERVGGETVGPSGSGDQGEHCRGIVRRAGPARGEGSYPPNGERVKASSADGAAWANEASWRTASGRPHLDCPKQLQSDSSNPMAPCKRLFAEGDSRKEVRSPTRVGGTWDCGHAVTPRRRAASGGERDRRGAAGTGDAGATRRLSRLAGGAVDRRACVDRATDHYASDNSARGQGGQPGWSSRKKANRLAPTRSAVVPGLRR